jgi:ABC-2 type transport system ATP-binding protein
VDSLKDYILKSITRQMKFDEFWALKDINFTLEKGERIGILGTNGAGKSTLLKVIAGVFKPTEGSVVHKGKIVPLLELGAGFDKEYTGRENIYLYGAVLGYSKEFIDSKFDEIVKFSGLKKFLDVPLKNYSSGMILATIGVFFHREAMCDQLIKFSAFEAVKCCLPVILFVIIAGIPGST